MGAFIVGIDLGTTNTVVAYAKTGTQTGAGRGRGKSATVAATRLFETLQLVSPGAVAALPLLPSVRYHATADELAEADLQLPWTPVADAAGPVVIGQWARQLGAQVPGRLVASAKSWLSHTAVDRLAPILPWGAADEIAKVSPVQASASYLAHVKAAWNACFPESPLEQQELVLTLPASFDESARALTLRAAVDAGLPDLRLLEEPQAVFYDWLWRHRSRLASELAGSRLVLVVDVGGGTTDLSLIQVELPGGQPKLTRIGVGNHLMLGGDNMDLALAHRIETRLASAAAATLAEPVPALSAGRLSQLVERCRSAKEQLLATEAPEQTQITLLGAGGRLIGGSRSVTLTRQEVEEIIVEGFFPAIAAAEPARPSRRGVIEFGLPFAREPAITRHIATFLRQHASQTRQALGLDAAATTDALPMPDTLLLNGGVFRAGALVKRLQATLAEWRGAPLRLLHNDNPDLAVARGAVAYALAQQGLAPKIGGGSARSYFLLLEDAAAAPARGVCLLPRGSEPGTEVCLSQRSFSLRLGQPVYFHLYSASADGVEQAPYQAGQLVSLDDADFVRLPPIVTALPGTANAARQQQIPVQLVAALTEVGTLALHCVSQIEANQRWLLEFDLRHSASSGAPVAPEPLTATRLALASQKIDRIFGPGSQPATAKEVRQLRAQLEHILGPREQWPLHQLRHLADALWQRARGRRRSTEHERAWLNLMGYCLRPGFGDALDAWRMQQLWPLFAAGVQFVKDKQVCTEWWTLWRRVAGGLGATEQRRLLDDFACNLQGIEDSSVKPVPGNDEEMLRLGASLERIPAAYKVEIGDWLVERIQQAASATTGQHRSPDGADDGTRLWALGRIGARQPFYGSTHDVVPPESVLPWLETLLALDWRRLEAAAFAAAQMARLTDDRTRDLPLALRQRIAARLTASAAPPGWSVMVQQRIELDASSERRVVGEALPPGLKLLA